MKVKFKKLNPAAQVPAYKTVGAAGCDVYSVSDVTIAAMGIAFVPLGFSVEVPEGYECQVRPRSGLASKGITVFNSPGTVDSDFRGEMKVLLFNCIPQPVTLYTGERIAQLVFAPVEQAEFEIVQELSETERGAGGWGSTGEK